MINVDLTPDQRLDQLYPDKVMQYYLPYNINILISQTKRRIRRNGFGPTHANPVVIS